MEKILIDDCSFANFRTKDGRLLVGRILSIGERITTIKAIGFNSVHRVAHENVAKQIFPLSLDEMIARNMNAKTAAERRKEVDKAMKAERRRKFSEWDRDGYPTRYDFLDGTYH